MHLVILMTEHQLQMPISLVADESYFGSTVWGAGLLQIEIASAKKKQFEQ